MNQPIFRIFFENYGSLTLFLVPTTDIEGLLTSVSLWYSLDPEKPLQRVNQAVFGDIFEPKLVRSSNGVHTLMIKPLRPMQLVQTSKGWRALYPFSSVFAPLDSIAVVVRTPPFQISVTVHGTYRKSKQDPGAPVCADAIPLADFTLKISRFIQNAK